MTSAEIVCQIAITLLTGSSIWAFASRRYRLGFALGLASQPFWIYSTAIGGLWGMLAVSLWFTVNQVRGLANHRKDPAA